MNGVHERGRDIWRQLVSSGLFPVHERLKGHDSVTRRRALERIQWWPPERLEEHREQRLREFMAWVSDHVPYYRRVFRDRGIYPHELRRVADLQRLPLLDKVTIRRNTEALKAEGARDLLPFNTGGSTGDPLTFYLSRERRSHDVAAKWRATRWWGVDIGDPEVVLWGSPIELSTQDRVRSLRDWLIRSHLFPAFAMSDNAMDQFLKGIQRIRPRMLFGYPSALALLAERARQRGVAMDAAGVRVVFVTGERLYPEQRAVIEQVFASRVANGYGGRDAGFVAHECPAGGLHISAEDVIVETVDPQGKPVNAGESGEIVITHLATRSFPFIRYRTGDLGVLDTKICQCGRALPLLREVQGRTLDFVQAADGTLMHGLALIYAVRDQPGIRRFKIIQENRFRTRLLVVADGEFQPMVADRICRDFRARLGNEVDVIIDVVDDIPPEHSGKYRFVESHAHLC